MASEMYNVAKKKILNGDLDLLNDTLYCTLSDSAQAFDADDPTMTSAIGSGEWSFGTDNRGDLISTCYPPGDYKRQPLIGKTITQDDSSDYAIFDAEDILFNMVYNGSKNPCVAVIIYQHNSDTDDDDNFPIAWMEVTNLILELQDFEVKWDSTGIIHLL